MCYPRWSCGHWQDKPSEACFLDLDKVQGEVGCFAAGKFDQIRKGAPYSTLVTAFNAICDGIVLNRIAKDRAKHSLIELLGEKELHVFSQLVSGVTNILKSVEESGATENPQDLRDNFVSDTRGLEFNAGQAFVRFKQQCRAFLRCVSSKEYPVVIFLDDLQFGDTKSIEVLQSMMESAAEFESLTLIASYRDDHVEGPHQALVSKSYQDPAFSSRATHIKVANLDRSKVNEMVSEILNLDPTETWDLSTICHLKTNGNPFFLQQFMRLLVSEQLLVYSHTTASWEWDDIKVQSETNVTGNILHVITERAKHIEPGVREVLQQASFLGFTFDVDVLQAILAPEKQGGNGTGSDLEYSEVVLSALRVAQQQGFIEPVGDQLACKWTHDRIMQSFHSAIVDEEEKARTHFRIGERLQKSGLVLSRERRFLLVDQFNLGSSCITEELDKLRLVEMNLDAGEICFAKSAFAMAERYFEQGIALLPTNTWSMHHNLTLRLYSNGAEAAHSNGDLENTMKLTACILANGQGMEEKLPAYCLRIQLHNFECRFDEASRVANTVLNELGVFIPLHPSVFHVLRELFAVKRLLKGKSDDLITSLPQMDKTNAMVMQVLGEASKTAYFDNASARLGVICLRAFRLSLMYGQCEHTPHGVAIYALIQSSMGKYHEAYRYGALALNMIQTVAASRAEVPVIAAAYAFVMHIQDPLGATLEPQFHGFQKAMELGDIAWALIIGYNACNTMLVVGTNLEQTESKLRMLISLANEFHETFLLSMMQTTLQAVLNLLGESEDAAILQGEAVPDLAGHLQQSNHLGAHVVRVCAAQTACIVESWEVAMKNCWLYEKHCSDMHHFHVTWPFTAICCGLSYMANYRLKARRRYLSNFRKYIKAAELHLRRGHLSITPTILFLKAEAVSLTGTKEMVTSAYGNAVDAMREGRYISQEGLAHEHFGNVMIERFSDHEAAARAYLCAIEKYNDWGATVKVDQVQMKLEAAREMGSNASAFKGVSIKVCESPQRDSLEPEDVHCK